MKSKKEKNPGCQTYGIGQTSTEISASCVSNHKPAGTALLLLVDLLSLLCEGNEGAVVSPMLNPIAGATTEPAAPLPDSTKVWVCICWSEQDVLFSNAVHISSCRLGKCAISLQQTTRRKLTTMNPFLAHACWLSRDGSPTQVFQSSLIIFTLPNANKLILTPLGQVGHICDFDLEKKPHKTTTQNCSLPACHFCLPQLFTRQTVASPGLLSSTEVKLAFHPCLFSLAAVKAPGKFWWKHKK